MKLAYRTISFTRSLNASFNLIRTIYGLRKFRRPLHIFFCYVTQRSPKGNRVRLKNGTSILLSSNSHDIITLLGVIARNDYGNIRNLKYIIDLGANIGSFTVTYAHQCKKMIAVEPNSEAFYILRNNILLNQARCANVTALHMAADKESGNSLFLPKKSSPYNATQKAILEHEKDTNMEQVTTISIPDILTKYEMDYIDLLKIDIEGAEYEILYNLAEKDFYRIRMIRMELHGSESDRNHILNFLISKGFVVSKSENLLVWLYNKNFRQNCSN